MAKKLNKTALYQAVRTEVSQVLASRGASDLELDVLAVVDKFLKPGVFGAKVDLDEVVKRDGTGQIVEIQCSLSKRWFPASIKNFYEDRRSSRIIGVEGTPLRRLSRAAEGLRKQQVSQLSRAKNEVQKALINGDITGEEAQERLKKLSEVTLDFSKLD